MKTIQSFWTKPFLQTSDSIIDSRMNGGWLARKYNYFSWALSCLQLRKFYDEVELVTDNLGKSLLIDKIKLPYTKVTLELNSLDKYHPGLWALGKLKAYSIQTKPFLHVDNDVFIWNHFPNRIVTAPLVAQNIEVSVKETALHFNEMCKRFNYIPIYLNDLIGAEDIHYSNAGIFGGLDVDFFNKYTYEVFKYIDLNLSEINEYIVSQNSAFVNIVYEQVIFNALANTKGKEITHLFPQVTDIPRDLGFFHAAKTYGGYMHCSGTAKKDRLVYEMLEIKMKSYYPSYYEIIMNQIENSEI